MGKKATAKPKESKKASATPEESKKSEELKNASNLGITFHSSTTGDEANAHARIATHETRGQMLLAAHALVSGQIVINEPPLIIVPRSNKKNQLENVPTMPTSDKMLPDPEDLIQAFYNQSQSTQDAILALHSPTDGREAETYRTHFRSVLNKKSDEELVEETVELHVKVAMAFNFNGVEVEVGDYSEDADAPASLGVGLYATACRLNHSCSPNCGWYASETGARIVRALMPVAEGEELTIDYFLEGVGLDIMPVHARRTFIEQWWEFFCDCPRCSANGDDTRKVHCTTGVDSGPKGVDSGPKGVDSGASGCNGGYHLVHQPTSKDVPILTPCSMCGNQPSADETKHVLDKEAQLVKALARINVLLDTGGGAAEGIDMVPLITQLQPPHPHHYLASKVSGIQFELYDNQQLPEKKAEALFASIECRETILHFPNRETVSQIHRHAAILREMASCDGAPVSTESGRAHLMVAQEACRRACQMLLVLVGPTHPHSDTATGELLEVQSRLPVEAITLGPEGCNLCGGKGVPHGNDVKDVVALRAHEGMALSACGKCTSIAYCCPEHQRAQWRLHKAACARIRKATPK